MRKALMYLLVAKSLWSRCSLHVRHSRRPKKPRSMRPAAADTSEEAMPSSSYDSCLESQARGG